MDEGPDLGGISCLKVLKDRKNWLAARIRAKQSVNYETTYDQREHDALDWIISGIVLKDFVRPVTEEESRILRLAIIASSEIIDEGELSDARAEDDGQVRSECKFPGACVRSTGWWPDDCIGCWRCD